MLNKIWAFMILGGIICGVLTGRMEEISGAAIESAGDAITLCITMAGATALWTGLMEIARKSGLVERMTKGIAPFLRFLFPRIPEGHPAMEHISTNVIANVLGLGWACTPAGLKAMEALADLERERGNPEGIASPEMCTFLIFNISSLQLIPVNMIAYRSQYGSASPAGIIAPALLATLTSTLAAIAFCKLMDRGHHTGSMDGKPGNMDAKPGSMDGKPGTKGGRMGIADGKAGRKSI